MVYFEKGGPIGPLKPIRGDKYVNQKTIVLKMVDKLPKVLDISRANKGPRQGCTPFWKSQLRILRWLHGKLELSPRVS